MSAESRFSQAITSFFGGGGCFTLAKGRVGLYAGLRAMNLPEEAQIVIPGYTCMVVPAAAKFAGLKPMYVDIDPITFNLDPAGLEAIDTDRPTVLLVQHTYGIPCQMDAITDWAMKRGVRIVEDCCHTFGTRFNGRLCGTFGAFAFMSGQWNKPFSTGLGGILLVNDKVLTDRVEDLINQEAHSPGVMENLKLKAQIIAYAILVRPSTTAQITKLYRFLTKMGVAAGSSSSTELAGKMPEGYFARMAAVQVRKGLSELNRIDANMKHRSEIAAYYHERLADLGFKSLPHEVVPGPLLRYPVRVRNKDALLQKAASRGIELGSWFEIPLHPHGTPMAELGYQIGMCPQGEIASQQVVNLPTHLKIKHATADRILKFLKENGEPIA